MRYLFFLFLAVFCLNICSCDWCEITGNCRDVSEVYQSNGIYLFEVEHVRFQYDVYGELMTVTNLTSVKATVRVTRYDDRADERSGVKFTLDVYNSQKRYNEQYRGTELWIQIWRDGVLTESYVRLN